MTTATGKHASYHTGNNGTKVSNFIIIEHAQENNTIMGQ